MIVVEPILSEVFSQLPELPGGFKPVYKWGNEYHLIKQLKIFADNATSPYPLIYQTSNQSKQDTAQHNANTNLVLIIATVNPNTELTNEERWEMSYKEILYPVVANIEKCFKGAGVFIWDGVYTVSEFPNYGDGKENNTIEKWDAIRFDVNITIESKSNGEPKCINSNIFKTQT